MKSITKIFDIVFLLLVILTGLFFTSNIYVIGNPEAAIEMHDDLPGTASDFLAITKVIVVFITGISFLITAYAIIKRRKKYAIAGFVGAIIFNLEYLIQLYFWYDEHPRMLMDFAVFGTLSLVIGIRSFLYWKYR